MKTLCYPVAQAASSFLPANLVDNQFGLHRESPRVPIFPRTVAPSVCDKQSGRRFRSLDASQRDFQRAAVSEVFCALARCSKKIPLLVGDRVENQVEVIRSLIHQLERNEVPRAFAGMCLKILDWNGLLEDSPGIDEFEWRVKILLGGNRFDPIRTIFVVPGLDTNLRISAEEIPIASMLRDYFYRRDLRFLGTASHSGFRSQIARREELFRRCWPIAV